MVPLRRAQRHSTSFPRNRRWRNIHPRLHNQPSNSASRGSSHNICGHISSLRLLSSTGTSPWWPDQRAYQLEMGVLHEVCPLKLYLYICSTRAIDLTGEQCASWCPLTCFAGFFNAVELSLPIRQVTNHINLIWYGSSPESGHPWNFLVGSGFCPYGFCVRRRRNAILMEIRCGSKHVMYLHRAVDCLFCLAEIY